MTQVGEVEMSARRENHETRNSNHLRLEIGRNSSLFACDVRKTARIYEIFFFPGNSLNEMILIGLSASCISGVEFLPDDNAQPS